MRVKKIDIFGFKSFANKQSITFGEGVTAVVGPNGCGKSNVVDAIRWVMGEQNPRHLRGGSMQDIIFCGSDKKAPLGYAEVILTIENNKSDAPLEYSHFPEIEIVRRLYKTGESEYEINKQKARLKDIADFFLGTGVGTKAYSIIEQGRVNDVISAKPHDRRLIIEEAAGITKYKTKKIAAERRMEACRQNLNRIVDIKNEVDKRVSILLLEKEKLLKVQSIKTQMRDIDLHISSHQYLSLWAILSFWQRNKEILEAEILESKRAIAFVEHNFLKTLEEYGHSHDQKRLLLDLETQHKTARELLKKDLEYTKSAQHECRILVTRLLAQTDDVNQRIAELLGDINRFTTEYEKAQAHYKEVNEEFLARKTVGQEVIERRQKHLLEERDTQRKITESATRAARLQAEINFSREQDIERELHIKNNALEIVQKQDQLQETQKKLEILKAEQNQGQERKQELSTRLSENNNKLLEEVARLDGLKKEYSQRKDEHVGKVSRLRSLKEIDESLEWSESGLQDLLRSDQVHLVKGILVNVIKAKNGYEDAVEKCLSQVLDAALIAHQLDLMAAVSFLKQKKAATTSFFVLDQNPDFLTIAKPLGLTCLKDLVDITDPQYISLHNLFSQIYIANNLSQACDHWPAARLAQATIVTLEGELLMPDGRAMILGQDNGQGVLKRRNELLELGPITEGLAKLIGETGQKITALDYIIATLSNEKDEINEALKPLNLGLVRFEENIKQKILDISNIEIDLLKLTEKNTKLFENKSNLDDKITEISRLWSSALDEHKNLEESLDTIKSQRLEVETEYDAFQNQLKEVELAKVQMHEKATSAKTSLNQTEKNLAHFTAQSKAFSEQMEEKAQEELRQDEHARQTERKLVALEKELSETILFLGKVSGRCEHIAAKKQAEELSLAAYKSNELVIAKKFHEAEMRLVNNRNEIKNLCDRVYERYRLNLLEEISDFHARPLDEVKAKKERDDLKRICDRMGPVNENAGNEYVELSARSTFLNTQVNDLNDALQQLEAAIKKINKTTRMRFMEAFNSINEKFSLVFPRLFNGGHAELRLVDAEDPLSCGVEILAKPPGKNIGSIELMSGGEKALTAISLIMAIFLIKPSPFCVLDEVDAPLDEANVARFSQLIKEMASLSQFIVITHNRKTMESADQLYGVTMEEAGQSKVVSVHVQQAFEALKSTKKRAPQQSEELPFG